MWQFQTRSTRVHSAGRGARTRRRGCSLPGSAATGPVLSQPVGQLATTAELRGNYDNTVGTSRLKSSRIRTAEACAGRLPVLPITQLWRPKPTDIRLYAPSNSHLPTREGGKHSLTVHGRRHPGSPVSRQPRQRRRHRQRRGDATASRLRPQPRHAGELPFGGEPRIQRAWGACRLSPGPPRDGRGNARS
jgi:hypothetical protein